jgi:predicted Zn-dependent protease
LAKSKIPDPLTRRHLIEGTLDPARAQTIAEAYLAADRAQEAVAFLARADDTETLEKLWQQAVVEGDPFLLREVSGFLQRAPDAATWQQLADAADATGKDRYAAEARRQVARLG